MANAGYIDSLLGGFPPTQKSSLKAAFSYVLDNLSFGAVEHQTRATNFQSYYITSTTAADANAEFSIAHGLGRIPTTLMPVADLSAVGSQVVPLTVSRAADASRVYLKSSSTGAVFSILVG